MSLLPNTLTAVPLVLRRWNQVDLPAVMGAIEVSIDDLAMWLPWAKHGVPAIDSERDVFATGAVDFDYDADWAYSIIEMDTQELVGGCGLHPRDGHTRLEIGYWVRSDRRARGYATIAARRLTDAAFQFVPGRMSATMPDLRACAAEGLAELARSGPSALLVVSAW